MELLLELDKFLVGLWARKVLKITSAESLKFFSAIAPNTKPTYKVILPSPPISYIVALIDLGYLSFVPSTSMNLSLQEQKIRQYLLRELSL